MLIPIASGSDVAAVLTDLFVVLLAAKIGDEICRRIGQPGLIGEIVAGALIGPSILGLVEPGEVLQVFAEVGVVFLLFWVGLETKIGDLRSVGKPAALAGTLGVIFPFAAGLGLGFAIGENTASSVFIASALVATSVGITSAVLMQLGVLDTKASRTILGAAIVDDILAMLLLAFATGLSTSSLDVVGLLVTAGLAITFVTFFALGGTRAMRARPEVLQLPKVPDSALLLAVIGCLGLAALANAIGLAAIIGAFLAGLIFSESKDHYPLELEIKPLYSFLSPFFFAVIGMSVNLDSFANGGNLALLGVTVLLAAATKFVGAWIGSLSLGRNEAAFVGLGMIPRGEVGIVVAGIGRSAGVIGDEVFAVIVGMSIVTTLITPPLLRRASRRIGVGGDGLEPPTLSV